MSSSEKPPHISLISSGDWWMAFFNPLLPIKQLAVVTAMDWQASTQATAHRNGRHFLHYLEYKQVEGQEVEFLQTYRDKAQTIGRVILPNEIRQVEPAVIEQFLQRV